MSKCFYYQNKKTENILLFIYAIDFDEAESIRYENELYDYEFNLKFSELINNAVHDNLSSVNVNQIIQELKKE